MRSWCPAFAFLAVFAVWHTGVAHADGLQGQLRSLPDAAPAVPSALAAEPTSTLGASSEGLPPPAPEPDGFRHNEGASLYLEELLALASQCNPTLVQAGMAVRAAEGNHLQAGLYPNPVFGYVGDEIGNEGTAGFQGDFLRQEVVTAGKLRLERAVAGHEIQQARCALAAQQQKVFNDVRAGFYDALLAQKMIDINDQLVRVAEESVTITEKLRVAKEVSRADVLQARIEAETAGLNLNEAQNRHRGAWRRLAAVVGRPAMEPAPLKGNVERNLPTFTWDDTLQDLLTRSPELGRARAGVDRARCELARQFALRVPNLEVGAAVKRDNISGYTVADVEFGLPLPVFDRNQGNISKARADLVAAEHEVRRIELSLQDRLATGFERYANARYQVTTYTEKLLPHARESLELVRAGYREGEFGYLSLLTAQRTFFSVNLDYLKSLQEFWSETVELEGLLLGGGLEKVSASE